MYFVKTFVSWGHCDHDRMEVGFITTYAISAYHPDCCEFEPCTCVLDTTFIM